MNPAVLTVSIAFPAPEVTASKNTSASPAVLTVSTSLPAPAVTAGSNASASPAVLTVSTSLPAPAVTQPVTQTQAPLLWRSVPRSHSCANQRRGNQRYSRAGQRCRIAAINSFLAFAGTASATGYAAVNSPLITEVSPSPVIAAAAFPASVTEQDQTLAPAVITVSVSLRQPRSMPEMLRAWPVHPEPFHLFPAQTSA